MATVSRRFNEHMETIEKRRAKHEAIFDKIDKQGGFIHSSECEKGCIYGYGDCLYTQDLIDEHPKSTVTKNVSYFAKFIRWVRNIGR